MPALTVTVLVEQDGVMLPRFPIIRRLAVTEAQAISVKKAGGDGAGVYVTVPGADVSATDNLVVLATDNPLNLKLASVAPGDGIIALKAGGLLVAMDCNLAAGATVNVQVNNPNASPDGDANLSGVIGGS